KQLVYEWSVQNNLENSITSSEFWIPFYSKDADAFQISVSIRNPYFAASGVHVEKINFQILQAYYIK
ncbi:hypothetical protein LJ737_26795, partial [Hymenobacter sp. 15J16-1T3B]|uniref:hypothetical protein n=1 Tax=Hymenobacter sp. 15J16-1T3B TaxID=2886941 RepID=UPI001D1296C7